METHFYYKLNSYSSYTDNLLLYEFMAEKKSEEILKGARLAGDEKLIQSFLKNLNKTGLSVYGYDEIISPESV